MMVIGEGSGLADSVLALNSAVVATGILLRERKVAQRLFGWPLSCVLGNLDEAGDKAPTGGML